MEYNWQELTPEQIRQQVEDMKKQILRPISPMSAEETEKMKAEFQNLYFGNWQSVEPRFFLPTDFYSPMLG